MMGGGGRHARGGAHREVSALRSVAISVGSVPVIPLPLSALRAVRGARGRDGVSSGCERGGRRARDGGRSLPGLGRARMAHREVQAVLALQAW